MNKNNADADDVNKTEYQVADNSKADDKNADINNNAADDNITQATRRINQNTAKSCSW